jgi:REP element-mobilizing transposase RayT
VAVPDDRPFALHITWTCYGTWLPGDRRSHVSNVLLPEGGFLPKENVPGTPYHREDDLTNQKARELQKGETVFLTAEQALVVVACLCEAAQARGWRILRGAIMANHVHVLVMDCPNDGSTVRRILKGTSQAALNDHIGHTRRWWTQGGSDRYKNDWPAIEAAARYIEAQPGILAQIVDGRAAGFTPAEGTPPPG